MTEVDALGERLFGALTGALELFTVEIGRELGLYAALRDGPLTPPELAKAAGIDERYAREWLEQQAAAGFLTADFALAPGVAEVLLDEGGPAYAGAASQFAVGVALLTPRVIAAFRSGEGVPYSAYAHVRHGIAGFNRPMFDHLLTTAWLPAVPEIEAGLRSGARVLDLGCGMGYSSVAMALAYPAVTVRGVDLDEDSIAVARSVAAAAGVADRVSFTVADAASVTGSFHLITIFEALHDMGDPVGVLRNAGGLLSPGGSVFIADERVADEFTAPAGEVERLQYAFSVLHCLPATRAENPVLANGTVLRAPTLLGWAREAGFSSPAVLDIDNDFWRFYQLH
ncbi:2-polyprenyl-3-methyl-5-hydroxy-6-metoxy-1,4-benzoquinol methylase [Actinoplanes lutulentus]|uniref:Methyltransferase family protein n=1 Tax=Actinoplanes lutulentus TaxID=1287878 RepID=A0A327ZDK3_9ACTN|nr:methyltransferase domain-containing protein [Actinoplanes lutulentus]MBB2942641.1 2-polyprenyl-3-methyl-5-hydroxy-6-metoxy-1,4-benzoquinol methylase [Actinoplanes lutulentus]RAK38222.1 methyltransferase family protein [Actinoplanes lutulentus]